VRRQRRGAVAEPALAERRVLHLHRAIPVVGTDVDQRRVLDAVVGPPAGEVVGAPQVFLATALLERQVLGVGLELAADPDAPALDVDDQLDHVAEEELGQALELFRRDPRLNDHDLGFGGIHDGGASHRPAPARARPPEFRKTGCYLGDGETWH